MKLVKGPKYYGTVRWHNVFAKNFEFLSILCRHVLSVFFYKDCYQIPSLYLPPHWCLEALLSEKELLVVDDKNLVDKENMIDANVNDMIDGDCFINCPPLSKTKGCPKQKPMKGGRKLGKKKKSCGLCKYVGHNISTCPEKDNCISLNGAKKRKKMYFKWNWIESNIFFEMLGINSWACKRNFFLQI